jgi:hypothetical protein
VVRSEGRALVHARSQARLSPPSHRRALGRPEGSRLEDRKRRGRVTHYERVSCVAPGLKVLRELQVCRLLLVAIVGC